HSGTLDPNVSGVLPIALGKATRIVQTLLPAGKEYVCLMRLHKDVDENRIRSVMEKFIGKITQLPPVKSAVKRQLREREIYYLNIMEISGKDVLFRIGCQAGTYIRTVCTGVGKELGIGAHMQQLVRTKAGPFTDREWTTLQDLKDAYEFYKEGDEKEIRKCIKPYETAAEFLPKVWIFDSAVNAVCNGAEVYVGGVSKFTDVKENELAAIMTLKNELVGLGTIKMESDEIMSMKKGVTVKTDAVFMERNTYPKFKSTNNQVFKC
ncbi:MAG: RNA-guided pseudouridylation complex pseudouridine synthase subunit Cbf5, partial [Nanoarchaeota archaeon]